MGLLENKTRPYATLIHEIIETELGDLSTQSLLGFWKTRNDETELA